MRKLFTVSLLIFALGLTSLAQKKQNFLLTIGNEKITLDDFLRIYKRNNSNIQDSINKKTAAEYLELFINFKLKVLEAKNAGLDTTTAFRNELAGYRTELAAPYLTDVSYNEKQVFDTYQRMRKEINASHILIRFPDNPSPADTLAAFKQIAGIRDQIVNGLDFNDAAVKYSQDPSVETNRGDLGWFSVFQMVFPFETAAYTTPTGQISQPFRTSFGYHLMKVNGVRDAEGEIHVAHIMKIYKPEATPEEKEIARQAADSLYQLLLDGADFATLAQESSNDERSAQNGGEMPWFSRSRMIPAFSDPAFALKNDGDISKPIDSGFGYHIIKRLELKPVPPFEEVKREIEEKIKYDRERSAYSQQVFIDKLKEELHFTRNDAVIKEVLEKTLHAVQKEQPELPVFSGENLPLFSYGNVSRTAQDWTSFLNSRGLNSLPKEMQPIAQLFTNFENETILKFEDSRLEDKYPDFRSLMSEYHDGMLLFDISEKKIWQRASADTTGLEKFYETNKSKYMWPERFKGLVVQCFNPFIRDETEKYLEMDIPVSEIIDILRIAPGSIDVREGAWAKKEDPVVDYYIWDGPKPQTWNDRTGFIHGKLLPPEPKLLGEARGYHIADYQQYLEDQWIKELRNKYKIKINKKLVKTLTDA